MPDESPEIPLTAQYVRWAMASNLLRTVAQEVLPGLALPQMVMTDWTEGLAVSDSPAEFVAGLADLFEDHARALHELIRNNPEGEQGS